MRSLTISQFDAIFQSETTTGISFHDERIKAINEAGEVLCQKFEGSFMSLVSQAEQSCQRLIEMVISHFPTFNDVAQFNGGTSAVLKCV